MRELAVFILQLPCQTIDIVANDIVFSLAGIDSIACHGDSAVIGVEGYDGIDYFGHIFEVEVHGIASYSVGERTVKTYAVVAGAPDVVFIVIPGAIVDFEP